MHQKTRGIQIQPAPFEMASKVISLQTIDMSPYLREGDEKGRKKVVEEIWKASTECGFFQAVNHGIPVELLKKTRRIYREFFDRPDEEKLKCVPQVYERPSPGYFKSQQFGTKEGHEDFLTVAPGRLNVYPKDFPEFKQVLEEIFPYLVKLASAIEEIINSASGLPPNFLKEYNDDRNRDFLLGLHYPAAENLANIGRYPHEDVNLITFVYQDHVGGLQVLNNGQWIPVIPDDEKLVVNIGDILQVLSNNKLKSATHRVFRTEGTERDSFAFFYSLKPDKWVEPLPQFTTEIGEPPKYRGFLYDDYMQLRQRDYTDNQPDKYEDIARITYYAINA
ncbi:flavonol synthase/flavanone 3-hydroxylase-like [Coffea eugenioides]|uniref:flavonol synthase/flavanone 3-hydroxylase-like n=1 Tax=Coffea eugenioides TaxID=49369 RepID=UPI000F611EF3|nr:flavonol synthase/flavanone 3-hydroxylase-like [Coffea eugenioides]